jgi:hypothetical protein
MGQDRALSTSFSRFARTDPERTPVPSGVAAELVQVMAGLILSRGKDTCYA